MQAKSVLRRPPRFVTAKNRATLSTRLAAIAGSVLAVLAAVVVGSSLSAGTAAAVSPHNLGLSSWTDCGPKICTKYWSKERTNVLYDDANTLGWEIGGQAVDAAPIANHLALQLH